MIAEKVRTTEQAAAEWTNQLDQLQQQLAAAPPEQQPAIQNAVRNAETRARAEQSAPRNTPG